VQKHYILAIACASCVSPVRETLILLIGKITCGNQILSMHTVSECEIHHSIDNVFKITNFLRFFYNKKSFKNHCNDIQLTV
ncbi:hypothetical protein, partial [Nostoc sp. PCC 9305]|uniref:hypothetical protein n=1 Tax=Nostoc sp. PCC 9305 TaxID=296636 RepID=UPI0039C68B2A